MRFKLHIDETLKRLMAQEDTDGDKKITIEDTGPKSFNLKSTDGQNFTVKGTYYLSNLLQELVLEKNDDQQEAEISISSIEEPPATRISRMIRERYWDGLTRTMDEKGISNLVSDTKNRSLTAEKLPVYIPFNDHLARSYYNELANRFDLKVIDLPEHITPQYVKSINHEPGILSLKLQDKNGKIEGVPFVVPGGRFNEMYGWDSYFESVGLILDGRVDLAKAMAENFQYEIIHYGKILNANRSYYLTRTQPPFYSTLIRAVFEETKDLNWLRDQLETAILEYHSVWMVEGERLSSIGLNRYLANGLGIPPETEEGHFDAAIKPYADALGLSILVYINAYDSGHIINEDLDLYFTHDRSMRESGHDTSNRLDGKCADLVPVELNALLYKYESDFAELIKTQFNDQFSCQGATYTSNDWLKKAEQRRILVDTYLWNSEKHLYLDYNLKSKSQEKFVSATCLVPLWSNLASQQQGEKLALTALNLLKQKGGIVSCTKESRGVVNERHPQRQWDFPNGWAPHQMMIWSGFINYGLLNEAQELIYRWLYMITKNAVDYNGTIPEKYDVVKATHKVFAEYGNVGTDFNYITQEGFGWMNASYQFGLSLLNPKMIENLNGLIDPEELF